MLVFLPPPPLPSTPSKFLIRKSSLAVLLSVLPDLIVYVACVI